MKLEAHRILVAADNREGFQLTGGTTRYLDHSCKIGQLGQTVAAISGVIVHAHLASGRTVLDWNGLSDARSISRNYGDDTDDLARRWGQTLTNQIGIYAHTHPATAAAELDTQGGAVIGGLFFRWVFGAPILKVEWVSIERIGVVAREATLQHVSVAQSTNVTTQDLIKGNSPRAKEAARGWRLKAKEYPAYQRDWKYLQFLIEETSRYDHQVSPTSDVVEIRDDGTVKWLNRSACH